MISAMFFLHAPVTTEWVGVADNLKLRFRSYTHSGLLLRIYEQNKNDALTLLLALINAFSLSSLPMAS